MKRKLKSPIKEKNLRNPGESVHNQLIDNMFDQVLFPAITIVMMLILLFLEWWRWYFELPPKPILLGIVITPIILYSSYKVFTGIRKSRFIRQGLDGEKAVGQYLDRLKENGAKVLHDIPGDRFNIDHVVINDRGIFVIETKTLSKPEKGEAKLQVIDNKIYSMGKELNRNPITQSKAGAKWIETILRESTGKSFSTHPVVLFPGWFIENHNSSSNNSFWILNPKALPTYIGNKPTVLNNEEINMCNYHLSRFIRTSENRNY